MVDWTSAQEIAKDSAAYTNLVFACFGLYVWEVFQTSDFELSLIGGRRKVQWQWGMHPFFFACRYIMILSLAGLLAASSTLRTAIHCQALYTFVCVTGNLAIICSSTTLMLRTIAVWERKLPIVVTLGVLCLAHWALLFRGMFIIHAEYSAPALSCTVTSVNRLFLGVSYWATMAFNLVILVLHIVGLVREDGVSSIYNLLITDGLILYLIAFSCNALPAILNALNLNPVMDIISTVPAAVMTCVAACRTITRLADVDDDDVYVHSSTQLTAPRVPASAALRFQSSRMPPRPEVHVTTDHIVMEDFACPSSVPDKSPSLLTDADDKSGFNAV